MQVEAFNNWGVLLSQAFNEVSEKVLDYTDVLIHSAQILCGIFAFAYIGLRLWKQWSRGETIDFYSYLRPFSIGLIIAFFTVLSSLFELVVKPVETITLSINSEISEDFIQKEQEFYTSYESLRNKVAEYERNEVQNCGTDLVSNELNFVSEEAQKVSTFRLVVEFVDNLVQYIQLAVIYFFPLYVSISKVILLITGPFMLALSILPGFTSNLKFWITYYLRIMIIPTISYLVGSFIAIVNIYCYYTPLLEMLQQVSSINDDFLLNEAARDFIFNKDVIGIVIGLITIFIYLQIPRFANWIIKPDRIEIKS